MVNAHLKSRDHHAWQECRRHLFNNKTFSDLLNLSLTFSSQSQDSPRPGLFAICIFIWAGLGARWPHRPLTHHTVHSAGNITSHPFRRRRHWAETPWYFFSCNQRVRDSFLVMETKACPRNSLVRCFLYYYPTLSWKPSVDVQVMKYKYGGTFSHL